MLENTFCHIPRITLRTEEKLWSAGIHGWRAARDLSTLPVPRLNKDALQRHLDDSMANLQLGNAHYFADLLPPGLHWRLFPEFRDRLAFLDIETTGLSPHWDKITTIALYDGQTIRHYVQGENLSEFKKDIQAFEVLVTYNGKCFDVPFLRDHLKMRLNQVHIDLRYVLHSLGFSGGLKGCEKRLGIDRGELDGVDGFMAVVLWGDFKNRQNPRALETLLCYNIQDVLNLETLLVMAYNRKLKATPFARVCKLPMPVAPKNPFQPDLEIVNRMKREFAWHCA